MSKEINEDEQQGEHEKYINEQSLRELRSVCQQRQELKQKTLEIPSEYLSQQLETHENQPKFQSNISRYDNASTLNNLQKRQLQNQAPQNEEAQQTDILQEIFKNFSQESQKPTTQNQIQLAFASNYQTPSKMTRMGARLQYSSMGTTHANESTSSIKLNEAKTAAKIETKSEFNLIYMKPNILTIKEFTSALESPAEALQTLKSPRELDFSAGTSFHLSDANEDDMDDYEGSTNSITSSMYEELESPYKHEVRKWQDEKYKRVLEERAIWKQKLEGETTALMKVNIENFQKDKNIRMKETESLSTLSTHPTFSYAEENSQRLQELQKLHKQHKKQLEAQNQYEKYLKRHNLHCFLQERFQHDASSTELSEIYDQLQSFQYQPSKLSAPQRGYAQQYPSHQFQYTQYQHQQKHSQQQFEQYLPHGDQQQYQCNRRTHHQQEYMLFSKSVTSTMNTGHPLQAYANFDEINLSSSMLTIGNAVPLIDQLTDIRKRTTTSESEQSVGTMVPETEEAGCYDKDILEWLHVQIQKPENNVPQRSIYREGSKNKERLSAQFTSLEKAPDDLLEVPKQPLPCIICRRNIFVVDYAHHVYIEHTHMKIEYIVQGLHSNIELELNQFNMPNEQRSHILYLVKNRLVCAFDKDTYQLPLILMTQRLNLCNTFSQKRKNDTETRVHGCHNLFFEPNEFLAVWIECPFPHHMKIKLSLHAVSQPPFAMHALRTTYAHISTEEQNTTKNFNSFKTLLLSGYQLERLTNKYAKNLMLQLLLH